MADLVQWLTAQLDADERIARDASGSTVEGEPGSWKAAPGGDEWEASRTDCDEDELLVALRPGLPRPPDVMSGMWGAIVDFKPALEDARVSSPLPQFVHAARHDPARVLREVKAKRSLVAAYADMLTVGPDIEGGYKRPIREALARQAPNFLMVLALPYADRPGFAEAIASVE